MASSERGVYRAVTSGGARARRGAAGRVWFGVLWGWIVVVLVAAAVVVVVVVAGGGRSAWVGRVDREVGGLLAGIPQVGDALGSPTAPVTLQFFGDLECLTTKEWVVGLLPAIIREFVRTGVVRIEYRSFKTDTRDPRVFVRQQAAAVAAGAQNRLWDFVETFYYEQGREYTPYATEGFLDGIAGQVHGLNLARWRRDREGGRRSELVAADDRDGRMVGFYDTPSFRIGRTGGLLRNFAGRRVIIVRFFNETHPLSLIDTQDLRKVVGELLYRRGV